MTNTETRPQIYNRNLTITQVNIGTDKNGRPYANFRADARMGSGPRQGEISNIFCQAFGKAYDAIAADLKVGAVLHVYGRSQQREVPEGSDIPPTAAYIVYGKSMPRTTREATLSPDNQVAF